MLFGFQINNKDISLLQEYSSNCGATCLRMIIRHYLKGDLQIDLDQLCNVKLEGSSFYDISQAATNLGFQATAYQLQISELHEINLPCILQVKGNHFVVLTTIKKDKYHVLDPSVGKVKIDKEDLHKIWAIHDDEGFALTFRPTDRLMNQETKKISTPKVINEIKLLSKKNATKFGTLILLITLGCLSQLAFPLISKELIDKGIQPSNLSFIVVVLSAQLFIGLSVLSFTFWQTKITKLVEIAFNRGLSFYFLGKLLSAPISYFQNKKASDIQQRINDIIRVDSFFSTSVVSLLFSGVLLLIYSVVLIHYRYVFFIVYTIFAFIAWTTNKIFLDKQLKLDSTRFNVLSDSIDVLNQTIEKIKDIKYNNLQDHFGAIWKNKLEEKYSFSAKDNNLQRYRTIGIGMLKSVKTFVVTLLIAKQVVDKTLTLGDMMAILYMFGQLDAFVEQIFLGMLQIKYMRQTLFKMESVFELKHEDENTRQDVEQVDMIHFDNIEFSYRGSYHKVFDGVNLTIHKGQTLALLGESGSGKSSLLKLLLKDHCSYEGNIWIDGIDLKYITYQSIRNIFGIVSSESSLFNDTIAFNISLFHNDYDIVRINNALKLVNMLDFVNTLPASIKTKVGKGGIKLSDGQQQRLLIARIFYKNPQVILLDEATSALDIENENYILDNIRNQFGDRIVIMTTHRNSAAQKMDNIIHLKDGKIAV
jgi:ATP-binding cassette, subfamily B, bacterial